MIGMSCKGCCFCEENDSQQSGCQMGQLEAIEKESSIFVLEDGYHQFSRVCPFKSYDAKTKEQATADATFSFHFLIVDTDNEKTVESLLQLEPLAEKYNGRICISTQNLGEDLKKHTLDKKNVYVSVSFHEGQEDSLSLMDKAFQSAKNGYSFVLFSGDTVSEKKLLDILDFVNTKMKQLALIQDSPVVINNVLFKFLKQNKVTSFKEKVEQLTLEQEGVNMVYTWKEIDEIISM